MSVVKLLSPRELELMKVVWKLEEATVREVYEVLRERRKTAYTSVMTIMNILEEKGFLKKWQEGRAYVYQPTRPKDEVRREMLRDFVSRVFNGSAQSLMLHLVQDPSFDATDRDEIRKILEGRS